MSVQTELHRIQTAKADLKTAIQAKGVTVPDNTTLDGYGSLVSQISTGDMQKSVYDTKNRQTDVYNYADDTADTHSKAVAPLYTALYRLDDWEEADEDAKSKGYAYRQTVPLTPDDPDAPTVTADSVFVTGGFYLPTGIVATDEVLDEALASIRAGYTTSGAGTVTTLVVDKPVADIPVRWVIRT